MDDVEAQVVRFYDTEAASYDGKRYESARGKRTDAFHKAVLLRLLGEGGGRRGRILDLGCGTGRLLEVVARQGYDVVGVDLSRGMLARARARLDRAGMSNVDLVQASPGTLPFEDHSFAAVYSIFVVNLIPDYASFFAKVADMLRPGGHFIFNVPNLMSIYLPGAILVNLRRRTLTRNAAGFRYSHWFRPAEWRHALLSAGLLVDTVLGQPPWCGHVVRCRPLDASTVGTFLSKSLFISSRLAQR